MNTVPLETLTLAKFVELVSTSFCVGTGPQPAVELVLVQAMPGGTFARGGANLPQYESFSLLFHGAEARPLQQGTYLFEHPRIGRFELFIVPVAAENGMIHYQAVFNRLVNPA